MAWAPVEQAVTTGAGSEVEDLAPLVRTQFQQRGTVEAAGVELVHQRGHDGVAGADGVRYLHGGGRNLSYAKGRTHADAGPR